MEDCFFFCHDADADAGWWCREWGLPSAAMVEVEMLGKWMRWKQLHATKI
jgi:hypothetical protein